MGVIQYIQQDKQHGLTYTVPRASYNVDQATDAKGSFDHRKVTKQKRNEFGSPNFEGPKQTKQFGSKLKANEIRTVTVTD